MQPRGWLATVAVALLVAPAAASASTSPKPARRASPEKTSAGPGRALQAYLGAVNRARAPYLVAGPAAGAALQKISPKPDATWLAAATKTKTAEQAALHFESGLKSLTPPPGLERANQQYAEAAHLAALFLQQVASALARENVAAVNAASSKIHTVSAEIKALETKWQTTVIAAAKRAAVNVPGWVTAPP